MTHQRYNISLNNVEPVKQEEMDRIIMREKVDYDWDAEKEVKSVEILGGFEY